MKISDWLQESVKTLQSSNIPAALAGDIDDIIEQLHAAEHELLSQE
jgi:hypothetical protein